MYLFKGWTKEEKREFWYSFILTMILCTVILVALLNLDSIIKQDDYFKTHDTNDTEISFTMTSIINNIG